MNERIRELKNQTLDRHFARTWTTMDYDDITRFAEGFARLIVQECIEVSQVGSITADKLKQHFGIEP